jgi:hypothetical protein
MYKDSLPCQKDSTIWHNKINIMTVIYLLFAKILLVSTISVVYAQADHYDWSEPLLLYQVEGTEELVTPNITTDDAGNIHVFWRAYGEAQGGESFIYYMRSDGEAWTMPVDVVDSLFTLTPRATVDKKGFIHLIWVGPGRTLTYSSAPVTGAESASNWSRPKGLNDANSSADIVLDLSGTIHVAYAGLSDSGIYYRSYTKSDDNWSLPNNISPTMRTDTSADYARLAVSENGTLHAVWTEYQLPDGWPPTGVYYSQSSDGGANWSYPVEMAGDGYVQINVIALNNMDIHVAWNGRAGVHGRFSRWSHDGGLTWSDIIPITTTGWGTEGPPQMVKDSEGGLHVLTTFNGCAWYGQWLGWSWSALECISGDAMLSERIEEPSMTISTGNKLHIVFWDDKKRLWYTSKETSSYPIPPIPFVTDEPIIPTETAVFAVGPQQEPEITHSADLIHANPPGSNTNIGQIVLTSLVPVIVIIGLIAIANLKIYRK